MLRTCKMPWFSSALLIFEGHCAVLPGARPHPRHPTALSILSLRTLLSRSPACGHSRQLPSGRGTYNRSTRVSVRFAQRKKRIKRSSGIAKKAKWPKAQIAGKSETKRIRFSRGEEKFTNRDKNRKKRNIWLFPLFWERGYIILVESEPFLNEIMK